MIIIRWGYNFELNDEWIKETGFTPCKVKGEHYVCNQHVISIIEIKDIDHNIRTEGVPIFNDGENEEGDCKTAKDRTTSILNALMQNDPLPPIKVEQCMAQSKFKYTIKEGAHRLHCSIAAGYTKIPAIII